MPNKRRLQKYLAPAAAGLVALPHLEHASAEKLFPPSSFAIQRPSLSGEFTFRYDGVLGTSLDLIVRGAGERLARQCENAVLQEIERLRGILSTYDPASEISRFCRGDSIHSQELAELLAAYDTWTRRSQGALDVNMAGVRRLWKLAEGEGRVPSEESLREAFHAPFQMNVDALGKGFVIDRAVEIARRLVPAGLLNIGGDLRAWGEVPWLVGVANPFEPFENAAPVTTFLLQNAAAATSGGYARFFEIGGRRFSHLIDPRTLHPASSLAAATVVAADALTANALSTAACVLGGREGAALAETSRAAGYFIVDATRGLWRGGMFAAAAVSPVAAQPSRTNNSVRAEQSIEKAWPSGFQVTIPLSLKTPSGGRPKRPYVAVWIEDSSGKPIRTLAFWGTKGQWQPEMSGWWAAAKGNESLLDSIARATRAPGEYALVWDGLNDLKRPVPQGTYTVCVEINREHGRHVMEYASLLCNDQPQSAEIRATAESEKSLVEYALKKP